MNRLRDESAADGMVGRGIDILRSTPGTPPMPQAQRRVWSAIEYEAGRARRKGTLRLSPLRVFALIAALVLLGGTAGAMMGHGGIGQLFERLVGRGRPVSVTGDGDDDAARAPPPRRSPGRDVTPQPLVPAAGDSEARAPVIAPPPRTERRRRHLSGTRGAASVLAPPPRAPGDGAVLDAMVALRQQRDPARAAKILARYLADYPQGALREEAMVLSIEAAEACGDAPGVTRLAKQYRASYPSGRFRPYVEEQLKRQ